MIRFAQVCLLFCCIAAASASFQPAKGARPPDSSSHQSKVTIEGLVRDLACPIQNLDAKATEINLQCALECVRHGSPIVIQTVDGELYIPISASMPDTDQREKLMPFVGKYVQAQGTAFERKGTRAIVISEIKEMKDVKLTTDAK
jgi:hypothetical protein